METTALVWSVAETWHAKEREAEEDLSSLGAEAFLPMSRTERIFRGRRVDEVKPLFPGYVFFNFADAIEWAFPRSVTKILGRMRDSEIARVKALVHDTGYVDLKRPRYRKGQLVRTSGTNLAFRDRIGTVERNVGSGQVVVLIDIFGRKTPITIGEGELTVA